MNPGSIFLSASVPYRRPDHYLADPIAVCEAVRALVAEIVADRALVFGGHPAISPFVWEAADSVKAADRVYIYQSELFRDVVPPAAHYFKRLIWTPAIGQPPLDPKDPVARKASLAVMRDWMIVQRRQQNENDPPLPPFDAGVFIGGMEGVEDEWDLFVKHNPRAQAFPIGSTEGAARLILDDPIHSASLPTSLRSLLGNDLHYRKVFRLILKP